MSAQRKGRDMRLKILACRQVYSGVNQRNDRYTIYEVDAERAEDGHRIKEKLRSFQPLPIGQVVEVTVTPFESERHGRSFTLGMKGGKSGSTDQLNQMREELDNLHETLRRLADRVAALEGGVRVGAQEASRSHDSAELDQKFGADPPQW